MWNHLLKPPPIEFGKVHPPMFNSKLFKIMEATIKKLGTSSNGNWVLLQAKQQLSFGNAIVSAFVTVEDHSSLTEGDVIQLTNKEASMIHWSL